MTAWTAERVETLNGPRVRLTDHEGDAHDFTPAQAELHAAAVERIAERFAADGVIRAQLLAQVEETRAAAAGRDVCLHGPCTREAVSLGFCLNHQPEGS